MRLEQLQYFVQIVENRSFNKAAQKLFVTQPALTSSMNQLEEELGVRLLVRTKRGVSPTAYGSRIYEDCKDIIDDLNRKISVWKSFAHGFRHEREVVSLLGIPFSCSYLMEEVIPLLRRKIPYADFVLHEAFHDDIYDLLKAGRARICVTFIVDKYREHMLAMYRSIHFNAESLLDDEFAVFLSTESPFAGKESLTVEDCGKLTFATYSAEYDRRGIIFNNIRPVLGIERYEYLNSRESVMQKIAQNRCAGLFLRKMSKNNSYIRNGLICLKSVKGMRLLPSTHYLLWLEDGALTEAERKTVSLIRENYAVYYTES